MELIIIIILLIVVIYLYNQTLIETKKKERYTNNNQCNRNCGNYNIDQISTNVAGCVSCGYCGVCTLPNKRQRCMNGDEDGAYFNSDCSGLNWVFGSGVINQYDDYGTSLDYESQLIELGQTDNLPSQVSDVSYDITDESTYNVYSHYHPRNYDLTDTTSALSNLLDKINSTNNKTNSNSNIDQSTIKQLQQILNQLQNSNN